MSLSRKIYSVFDADLRFKLHSLYTELACWSSRH